jgi:uncharacterized protein YjbJ (UPF0337 family)
MSEEPEVTREGLFETLAGKAKEAAGELVGNERLAESGRAEQARATSADHDEDASDSA